MDAMDMRLLEWASPRQREFIQAVASSGGVRSAARLLNVHPKTIYDSIKAVKKKAAAHGYSPEHDLVHTIPEPYVARGHSTYYDRDGKPVQQWVKTRLDDQKWLEVLRGIADALAEDLPRASATAAPSPDQTNADLHNLYVLTDGHLGALCDLAETGDEWNLTLAEATLGAAFDAMVDIAPPAATATIAELGDLLHSDGLLPVTPRSGHVLDQDGRYPSLVRAAVRLMRRVMDRALLRHERVNLLIAEGNHDESGSVWLRVLLTALYENEPRVRVVGGDLPYYAVTHGETALFFHHGHLRKPQDLPLLFAAQYPREWGAAAKRYVHCGHKHSFQVHTLPGARVVQHPTLAGKDAYAARGGWLSDRQATVLTYHRRFGQIAEHIVTPEMLR